MTIKEAMNSINTIATNIVNGVASDKNDESKLNDIVTSTEDIGK